jgi:hypothetical protein
MVSSARESSGPRQHDGAVALPRDAVVTLPGDPPWRRTEHRMGLPKAAAEHRLHPGVKALHSFPSCLRL